MSAEAQLNSWWGGVGEGSVQQTLHEPRPPHYQDASLVLCWEFREAYQFTQQ